jgi:hypothetical protein
LTWSGYSSGATGGIGYDFGQQTRAKIATAATMATMITIDCVVKPRPSTAAIDLGSFKAE